MNWYKTIKLGGNFPSVDRRKMMRALARLGFINTGVPASGHYVFRHPDGRVVNVTKHAGDIPIGTLNQMIRHIGISKQQFMRYL